MEAQWDVGGRILLGDNTGGGAVALRPVSFQCVWAWITTGLTWIYTYVLHYVYSVPTCAKL